MNPARGNSDAFFFWAPGRAAGDRCADISSLSDLSHEEKKVRLWAPPELDKEPGPETPRALRRRASMSTMTDRSVASDDGVRVIIVGGGYACLGCAIECKRKGHDVVVLEKVKTFKEFGEHAFMRRFLESLMWHIIGYGQVMCVPLPSLFLP